MERTLSCDRNDRLDDQPDCYQRLTVRAVEHIVEAVCKLMFTCSAAVLKAKLVERWSTSARAPATTLCADACTAVAQSKRGSTERRIALALLCNQGYVPLLRTLRSEADVSVGRTEFERARADLLMLYLGLPLEVQPITRQRKPPDVVHSAVDFILERTGSLSWGDTYRDVDGTIVSGQPVLVRLQRRTDIWRQYLGAVCPSIDAQHHGKVTERRPDACDSVHLGRTSFLAVASAITDRDSKQLTALDSVMETYVAHEPYGRCTACGIV